LYADRVVTIEESRRSGLTQPKRTTNLGDNHVEIDHLGVWHCGVREAASAAEAYNIPVILSLSGGAAFLGQGMRQSFDAL
jgi:hypothetical protein